MPRLQESDILKRITYKLSQLGCPSVRGAEGTPEWKRIRGNFRYSPDLVAGPLRGNGAPEDFLIDVFSPTGDQYVKLEAGAPNAAAFFRKAIDDRGTFSFRDLGQEYEPFYGPIRKKLDKYSTSRSGSPMVGLAMYFCLAGNSFVGPILAFYHVLAALDDAFGLTSNAQKNEVMAALDTAVNPGHSVAIVVWPLNLQLSFLLLHADKVHDNGHHEKTILLINKWIVQDDFDWKLHPVVQWLRQIAYDPLPESIPMPR